MVVAPDDRNVVTARWWTDEHDGKGTHRERHETVLRYVRTLEDAQHKVHMRFLDNAYLYHQRGLMGMDGEEETSRLAIRSGPSATNIIESNTDAVVALISRHKPRVVVATDGASFSMQHRAKWTTRWLEAEFTRTHLYDKVTLAFRDAAVLGTGVLHVYDDHDTDKPEVERVLIDDFIVDEKECRTTAPRQLHRRKLVDVDRAIEMFAKGKDAKRIKVALMEAAGGDRDWTWYRKCPENHVVLVESWHLPSSPKAKDGRHTICARGVTLRDEPYNEPDFPFIFFHWSPPMTGFYGRGVADILKPKQARLNRLRRTMTKGVDLKAVGRMFVHRNDAQLANGQLDNSDAPIHVVNHAAGISDYQFRTGQGVSQEVYADYERQKVEASEQVGASSEMTSGAPIPNAQTGAAVRATTERENGRFANIAERLEALYPELGDRLIRVQTKIVKRTGEGRTVSWTDVAMNVARSIPWEKVDPENDQYAITLLPASKLSRDLAGRIQEAIELAQSNALTQPMMLKVLNHPDLQGEYNLLTASTRACDCVMEMLDDADAEFPVPDPLLVADPEHLERVHARYADIYCLRMFVDDRDVVERVMQRYRDYIAKAEDTLGLTAPSAPVNAIDPAAMAPGPGAMPGPGVPVPGMPVVAPPVAA